MIILKLSYKTFMSSYFLVDLCLINVKAGFLLKKVLIFNHKITNYQNL